jgi:hypothetical protein
MNPYHLQKAIYKTFLIKKENQWKLQKKFPTLLFLPHMKLKEYQLFVEVCSQKNVFLEYGSGGSTIWLLGKNKKIFSVESNPEFYAYMKGISLVKKALDKNLKYQFIDLGPTNQWGKPLSLDNSQSWSAYYQEIWKSINPDTDKVDVVFIDGRFRVNCCLYSILQVLTYNWKDTMFLIHDFRRREQYHVVLDFLEEVKSAENLSLFKIKKNVNIQEIKERLEEFSLDFR